MRILRSVVVIFCFGAVFTACRKELSVENGTNQVRGLLVKAVGITGNDTLTTIYTYDNKSRLETETTDGKFGNEPLHFYRRYTRDFTTRITHITEQLTKSGVVYDTTRTFVHYADPIALEYDYTIFINTNSGLTIIDSTVYSFSGSQMDSAKSFTAIPELGIPPTLSEWNEFIYNSDGNVASRNLYSSVSSPDGSLLFTASFTYTYNGEPDYLWYTANAAQNYLLVGLPNLSNKNVSRLDKTDQTGNDQDLSITTTLNIGADNKADSGVVTEKPLNRVTRYTFYYQ